MIADFIAQHPQQPQHPLAPVVAADGRPIAPLPKRRRRQPHVEVAQLVDDIRRLKTALTDTPWDQLPDDLQADLDRYNAQAQAGDAMDVDRPFPQVRQDLMIPEGVAIPKPPPKDRKPTKEEEEFNRRVDILVNIIPPEFGRGRQRLRARPRVHRNVYSLPPHNELEAHRKARNFLETWREDAKADSAVPAGLFLGTLLDDVKMTFGPLPAESQYPVAARLGIAESYPQWYEILTPPAPPHVILPSRRPVIERSRSAPATVRYTDSFTEWSPRPGPEPAPQPSASATEAFDAVNDAVKAINGAYGRLKVRKESDQVGMGLLRARGENGLSTRDQDAITTRLIDTPYNIAELLLDANRAMAGAMVVLSRREISGEFFHLLRRCRTEICAARNARIDAAWVQFQHLGVLQRMHRQQIVYAQAAGEMHQSLAAQVEENRRLTQEQMDRGHILTDTVLAILFGENHMHPDQEELVIEERLEIFRRSIGASSESDDSDSPAPSQAIPFHSIVAAVIREIFGLEGEGDDVVQEHLQRFRMVNDISSICNAVIAQLFGINDEDSGRRSGAVAEGLRAFRQLFSPVDEALVDWGRHVDQLTGTFSHDRSQPAYPYPSRWEEDAQPSSFLLSRPDRPILAIDFLAERVRNGDFWRAANWVPGEDVPPYLRHSTPSILAEQPYGESPYSSPADDLELGLAPEGASACT